MRNRVRHWLAVGVCGAMFGAMLLTGTGVVSADTASDNDSAAQVAQQDGNDIGMPSADPTDQTSSPDDSTNSAP